MAIASDGAILINASGFGPRTDLAAAIRHARATRLPVFIGVVVPAQLKKRALRDIYDAAADVAGRVGGKLARPRT